MVMVVWIHPFSSDGTGFQVWEFCSLFPAAWCASVQAGGSPWDCETGGKRRSVLQSPLSKVSVRAVPGQPNSYAEMLCHRYSLLQPVPWPVNLLFSWKNSFPLAGNDCVARCCLLFFVGKGHGDDRERTWWLRVMFPSSVKGEITPPKLT